MLIFYAIQYRMVLNVLIWIRTSLFCPAREQWLCPPYKTGEWRVICEIEAVSAREWLWYILYSITNNFDLCILISTSVCNDWETPNHMLYICKHKCPPPVLPPLALPFPGSQCDGIIIGNLAKVQRTIFISHIKRHFILFCYDFHEIILCLFIS